MIGNHGQGGMCKVGAGVPLVVIGLAWTLWVVHEFGAGDLVG